jgi:hypothetical protein
MDVWAHCAACDRWFYCGQGAAAGVTCPVCANTAARVEDRDARDLGADARADPDRRGADGTRAGRAV